MALKEFIIKFQIPKAMFVEAVEAAIISLTEANYDLTDESYEPPNADIIYTFYAKNHQ